MNGLSVKYHTDKHCRMCNNNNNYILSILFNINKY